MYRALFTALAFFCSLTFCVSVWSSSNAMEQRVGLDEELAHYIHSSVEGPNLIGYIAIDGQEQISQATWLYIKGAADYYRSLRPLCIFLKLNTPGGEIFAAQKISDALKQLDTDGIPVIAYIDNWAISAGAMIAYSCRFIFVSKDASMGAAEPVLMKEGQMESASEKVISALRSDFASRAHFFGRNPLLAEAMVDKDLLLVWRDGKVVKLASLSEMHNEGQTPDILIVDKGKLLTLPAQQLMAYGIADALLPPYPSASKGEKHIPFHALPMSQQSFFHSIKNPVVDAYKMDAKMLFLAFLSLPAVSSLLFFGLLVCGYLEFNAPGFGIAGTIALTCLILIALSSFALEIASWLEVILLALGLLMVLLEFTFLPTGGLLAALGFVFFLGGLISLMLPSLDFIHTPFSFSQVTVWLELIMNRLAWLVATVLAAFLSMFCLGRLLGTRLGRYSTLVLLGNEQEDYRSSGERSSYPSLGTTGVVAATLRPGGKVQIASRYYDAISEGTYIDKGRDIVVTGLEGSTLIVKEIIRREGDKV